MSCDCGIYMILNKINGKKYIGSSISLTKRWKNHLYRLRGNKHPTPHLQAAYNKHGEENFEFRTLFFCDPKILLLFEQRALDYYKPEYNASPTAKNRLGSKTSYEARLARSKKMLGMKRPKWVREILSKAFKGQIRNAKTYCGLISPEGVIYKNITNMAKFGREHNFKSKYIYSVITGKLNHHKGWRLLKETQNGMVS